MLVAISMLSRMGVLMYETNMYEGMLAETVSMPGANGGNVSNMLLAVSYQHAEFIAIYK